MKLTHYRYPYTEGMSTPVPICSTPTRDESAYVGYDDTATCEECVARAFASFRIWGEDTNPDFLQVYQQFTRGSEL